jgi:hypothetical protein
LAWEAELEKKLDKVAPQKMTPQKHIPQKVPVHTVTPHKIPPSPTQPKHIELKLQQIMQEYSHLFQETPKLEAKKPPVKPPTHKRTPSKEVKVRSVNSSPVRSRVVSPRMADTYQSPTKTTRVVIPVFSEYLKFLHIGICFGAC